MTETKETWQERANRIQEKVSDDTVCQQLVYMSDEQGNDCVPMISPIKMDRNQFPFVVEAPPMSMSKPKYNWQATTPAWEDLDVKSQATTLADLKNTVDAQAKTINNQSKTIADLEAKLQDSLAAQADMFALLTGVEGTDNDQSK